MLGPGLAELPATPPTFVGPVPPFLDINLGARLRGRTATQRSEIRVLRRVLGKGFWGRGSQKGSQKGGLPWVLQ